MTYFTDAAFGTGEALCGLLFITVIVQLLFCLYQYGTESSRRRRIVNAALLIALAALMSYARAALHFPEDYPLAVPCAVLALIAAVAIVHAAAGFVREYRESRSRLTPDSIRQALDDLNSGICFADADGRIVLINRAMADLTSGITGSYPRVIGEIDDAVRSLPRAEAAPSAYRTPGGSVWQTDTETLSAPGLAGFTQMTARDITELYETNERIIAENEKLAEANDKTKQMYERLSDRIREQEILELNAPAGQILPCGRSRESRGGADGPRAVSADEQARHVRVQRGRGLSRHG